ncbi:heparin/heparin-sulfate lyase HepB [Paenibacillus hemerocallicola]|nr:heparin/heparin-sulfate lyase HepB [Paenibacillus hemerocallicola]
MCNRRAARNMLVCLLTLVLALGGALPPGSKTHANPAPLLSNGGFESGLTGWNVYYNSSAYVSVTDQQAYAGSYSLKVDDVSASAVHGAESHKFPVVAGGQYTATAYTRVDSGQGLIYLNFYNASNQKIDQKTAGSSATAGQWKALTASLTAPAGATTASVSLHGTTTNTGIAYYDEIGVVERIVLRGSVNDAVYASPVAWTDVYLYAAADTGFLTPLDKGLSNKDGLFSLQGGVTQGDYVIRAMKDGYQRATMAVEVGQGSSISLAVSLTPDSVAVPYPVGGSATVPATGEPIAGADIVLYDDDDLSFTTPIGTATSAADGTFAIDTSVPNGTYQVRATKTGFYATTVPVTVRDSAQDGVQIRMLPRDDVSLTEMPTPPAAHPRLYVTPDLIPQMQARLEHPVLAPAWEQLEQQSAIPALSGKSSGSTLAIESYDFPEPEQARFVKIVGRGNSVNDWNSITETELYTRDPSDNLLKLTVSDVSWSSQDGAYDGNKTIDGVIGPESRWSAQGREEWIQYDLSVTEQVYAIGLAWHAGNTRQSLFDVYVSVDGSDWSWIDLGSGNAPGELAPPAAGKSNYSPEIKNAIEYNAMKYLLKGDTDSGRLAIEAALRFMDTAVFADPDPFRPIGDTMHAAALVYDWCFPLLTAEEKTAFIANLKDLAGQMEMGYPPIGGGPISGHASENMLMRDWLAAGIAVYGEDPEMYNLSAQRFFNEFVPARNFWYLSGMNHQGDSYGVGVRYLGEMWAQWLFERMGHGPVFVPEQGEMLYRALYMRRPDGQWLRDGDSFTTNSNPPGAYWKYPSTLLLATSYYKDPYLQDEFQRQYTLGLNPLAELLFLDPDLTSSPVSQLPLTRYFGFPYGSMVARTGWSSDTPGTRASDVVAEMKVGNYSYGNHQHLDMGSFQLYYKGALALDSGMYQGRNGGYGSQHDIHYYKRTIAHNSMLVYDPAERFYSGWRNDGGQRKVANVRYLDDLLGKNYYHGLVLGQQFGPDPVAPDFSYIKGDLTAAYTSKVKQFQRSFLFLNLKDVEHPAAMVVFDKVIASDPNFRKYWLLHSMEEPQISGNTTTLVRSEGGYEGKLVNETLLPASGNARLEKVGGSGQEFEVFGANIAQTPIPPAGQHTIEAGAWRMQLSPETPSETDHFLNVMQVMDNDGTSPLAVEAVDSERMVGAAIDDYVVLFGKSGNKESGTVTFATYGPQPALKYVIADLASGTWRIAKTGETEPDEAEVGEEGGVLYFTGAPGTYTLTYLGNGSLYSRERQ